MRVAAYTDYVYHREGGAVYAERAFALFLARLGQDLERLVVVGRLDPQPGRAHYRLPDALEFVALAHYESLSRPGAVALAIARSARRFWAVLGEVDTVWLLGPHPLALAFVALARLRRRRIVLGVRQDLPAYVRTRHPRRRWIHLAGDALERAWLWLARRHEAIVVGPELARRYASAGRVLELSVSLVADSDLASPEAVASRSYDGELRALSVGRLEREKNPLLLGGCPGRAPGTVEAPGVRRGATGRRARGSPPPTGSGRPRGAARLRADRWRSARPVPHEPRALARVMDGGFAAGTVRGLRRTAAVVATDVGGIASATQDAALLIPPGDAQPGAAALERLGTDPELRGRLIEAGFELVRGRTLEAECDRVAAFLAGDAARD